MIDVGKEALRGVVEAIRSIKRDRGEPVLMVSPDVKNVLEDFQLETEGREISFREASVEVTTDYIFALIVYDRRSLQSDCNDRARPIAPHVRAHLMEAMAHLLLREGVKVEGAALTEDGAWRVARMFFEDWTTDQRLQSLRTVGNFRPAVLGDDAAFWSETLSEIKHRGRLDVFAEVLVKALAGEYMTRGQ